MARGIHTIQGAAFPPRRGDRSDAATRAGERRGEGGHLIHFPFSAFHFFSRRNPNPLRTSHQSRTKTSSLWVRPTPPLAAKNIPSKSATLDITSTYTKNLPCFSRSFPALLCFSQKLSILLKISRPFSSPVPHTTPLLFCSLLSAHCLLLPCEKCIFRSHPNRAATNQPNSTRHNNLHQKHPRKEPQKTPENLKKPRRTSKNPHRTSKNPPRTSKNLPEPWPPPFAAPYVPHSLFSPTHPLPQSTPRLNAPTPERLHA